MSGAATTGLRSQYLFFYNTLLAFGWAFILYLTAEAIWKKGSTAAVYAATIRPLMVAQTAAVLEILHAATGLVRSPLLTTAVQVFSRLWVLWGLIHVAPHETSTGSLQLGTSALQLNLATLLVAWSISEILRYSLYAFKEAKASPPYPLLWLRYTGFILLYPLGVSSELTMAWLALPVIKAKRTASIAMPNAANFAFDYHTACWVIIALYLPGLPMLYSYMLTQRRKILNLPKAKKA